GVWPPLPGAQTVPLKIEDQFASAVVDLGAAAHPHYTFQFSYVNSEGRTVYTQPKALDLMTVASAPAPPDAPPPPVLNPPAIPGPPLQPRTPANGETQIMGGAFDPVFRDEAPEGAVVVGFDVGLSKFFNNDIVRMVRPIYRTARGEVAGRQRGGPNVYRT